MLIVKTIIMIALIIILILTIILFIPLRVCFLIDNKQIFLNIYIFKLIKIKVNLKVFKKIKLDQGITKYKQPLKKLIKAYLKETKLERFELIIHDDNFLTYPKLYLYTYLLYINIRNIINKACYKANHLYEMKCYGKKFKLNIVVSFNLFTQILFVIKHVKQILLIIKLKHLKEVKIHA